MGAAFALAFVLVALAELGDKSQLLLLAFAARHRAWHVVLGAALAIAALQAVAVAFGGAVGALLPERLVALVAGALFVVFGVLTWRGADGDSEETHAARAARRLGPVLTVALAFFIAEFGDKTQLMTVSIAADPAAALRTLGALTGVLRAPEAGTLATSAGVWLGSSLGMLAADGLAIALGTALGARLPERLIARASGVIFVVFGAITLSAAFLG